MTDSKGTDIKKRLQKALDDADGIPPIETDIVELLHDALTAIEGLQTQTLEDHFLRLQEILQLINSNMALLVGAVESALAASRRSSGEDS